MEYFLLVDSKVIFSNDIEIFCEILLEGPYCVSNSSGKHVYYYKKKILWLWHNPCAARVAVFNISCSILSPVPGLATLSRSNQNLKSSSGLLIINLIVFRSAEFSPYSFRRALRPASSVIEWIAPFLSIIKKTAAFFSFNKKKEKKDVFLWCLFVY